MPVNDSGPVICVCHRVCLIFGVITCAAGISGVGLGLYFASLLRKVTKKADPLVCGIGLISSAPFLYLAIVMSSHNALLTWVCLTVTYFVDLSVLLSVDQLTILCGGPK